MRIACKLGLKTRLVLPIMAAFGMLLSVIVFQSFDERDRLRRVAEEDLLQKAQLIAARQHSLITRAEAMLDGLILRPGQLGGAGDATTCSQELRALVAAQPGFIQAGVVSPQGDILCAATPPPEVINVTDRAWFRQAKEGRGLVVSDVLVGRVLGKPVILVAKAKRDAGGQVARVFYLGLDLGWLQGELANARLPVGGRLWVMDRQGGVAVRYPDPEGWVGRSMASQPLMQRLLSEDCEGMLEETGLDGVARLFGYTPLLIGTDQLRLVMTVPKAIVEAPAQRRFANHLLVMLSVLAAMGMLLAWSGHRLLVRPLTILSDAAARLGAGDLDARSGLCHSDDEIGRLARTLDEAGPALRESETSYLSLFHNMLNGLAVCRMLYESGEPRDFLYLQVNPSFEAMTGLREVVGRRVSEVIPGIRESDPGLFEVYGRVAAGGAPEAFEILVTALGRWFAVSVYSPRPEHFVAVFDDITERKRAEAEQLAARKMLQTVIDTVPVFVFWKDRQSRFLGCNRMFARLAGTDDPRDLQGRDDYDFDWRTHAHLYQQDDARVMESGTPKYGIVEPLQLVGGNLRWLETSKVPLRDEQGSVTGVLGVFQDITERKQAVEALAASEREFRSLADNVPDNVARFDLDARTIYVNPTLEKTLGCPAAELLGRSPEERQPGGGFAAFERAIRNVAASGESLTIEQTVPGVDGTLHYHSIRIVAERDAAGRPVGVLTVGRDITEMRRKDEQLRYLAFHDVLTGLPNRALFQERLEQAIERARRTGERLSVTFIDLDGFKGVNDSLGHDIGDQLLQAVAGRIQSRLRRGTDTIARLGGDEFVVLMELLRAPEQCGRLAGAIITDISRPLELRGHAVSVSASMGIAFFPEDGADVQTMMKRADIAMYAAKQAGKGTYRFFHQDMLSGIG